MILLRINLLLTEAIEVTLGTIREQYEDSGASQREAIGQFLGGSEPNANVTQVQTHNGITTLINIFSVILEKAVYICVLCVPMYIHV